MLVNLPRFTSEEKFISFVKKTTARGSDSLRFLVLDSDFQPYDGEAGSGIRFTYTMIDRKAKKRSGETGPMILEIEGLILKHRDNPLYGLHMAYSHRCYEGEEDTSLAPRFETLLPDIRHSVL
jgi:hypothetical protein